MRVLIVEDEKDLSRSIVTYLKRENYLCDTADSVLGGLEKIEAFDYDCILLDISLPDGNGFRILKELSANKRGGGVIVISAKDSPDDMISGLNLGADDYLAKPFHLSELNARVAAVIRRKRFQGHNTVVSQEIVVDLAAKSVTVQQKAVALTRKEFDLLLYLISNKNRVISKNAIAENISGEDGDLYESFDFIYSHIKNLKRKLEKAGSPDRIKSVYGLGYKFVE